MPIIFAQLCVVDYFRVVYTDVKPCVTLETATDATKSRLMSCVAIAGRKLSTRLFLVALDRLIAAVLVREFDLVVILSCITVTLKRAAALRVPPFAKSGAMANTRSAKTSRVT